MLYSQVWNIATKEIVIGFSKTWEFMGAGPTNKPTFCTFAQILWVSRKLFNDA